MEIKTPTFNKIFKLLRQLFSSYKIVIFILLILAPLAFIGVVFYLYAWQVEPEDQTQLKRISVDLELYQNVMDKIKQREINFQNEGNKSYLDPFR